MNKYKTICFHCEAYRKDSNNKTFVRYIKCKYTIDSENDEIIIACRIYGCKIVENKGLPLINIEFKTAKILNNDLEELAAQCLNIPIESVISTNIIDSQMFEFLIKQHS